MYVAIIVFITNVYQQFDASIQYLDKFNLPEFWHGILHGRRCRKVIYKKCTIRLVQSHYCRFEWNQNIGLLTVYGLSSSLFSSYYVDLICVITCIA